MPKRAKETRKTILITGLCGRLGQLVTRALHRSHRVIGVDRRPFDRLPADVVHHEVDLRKKKVRDVFRSEKIDAVVHLGIMHDPRKSSADHHSWNVAGFTKLLGYAAEFGVKKVVMLSSANVYGPQPDNPQFLTEDAPLLGGANFSDIRDLIELDHLAQGFLWKHPEVSTVILRPVHIVGTVRNAASNFLRLSVIPTLLGFDPLVQLIHEQDVVRAIVAAVEGEMRGIYNLAGPEPIPLSRVIARLGRATLPVPYMLAKPTLNRLWNMRLTSFPPPELDHIRYVCMVDDARARADLGFTPRHDLAATIEAVNWGRW
jgi:UDP-glucose 4-epimerase